jgi:hypothetical protein
MNGHGVGLHDDRDDGHMTAQLSHVAARSNHAVGSTSTVSSRQLSTTKLRRASDRTFSLVCRLSGELRVPGGVKIYSWNNNG